jgi:hypothetical protein
MVASWSLMNGEKYPTHDRDWRNSGEWTGGVADGLLGRSP